MTCWQFWNMIYPSLLSMGVGWSQNTSKDMGCSCSFVGGTEKRMKRLVLISMFESNYCFHYQQSVTQSNYITNSETETVSESSALNFFLPPTEGYCSGILWLIHLNRCKERTNERTNSGYDPWLPVLNLFFWVSSYRDAPQRRVHRFPMLNNVSEFHEYVLCIPTYRQKHRQRLPFSSKHM